MVAVLREIKQSHPRAQIRFWCDKKFAPQVRSIMSNFDESIPVQVIISGKLRRYYHLSLMQHLMWPSLMLRNIRDSFLVEAGVVQSLAKLILWRPDVVFTKGGYVCLPVGLATKILGIPLVIHDSDAHPGLTNRILSRWASSIATGAPLEYYHYPKAKTRYVGIPVSDEFHPFSDQEVALARRVWQLDEHRPLIVVTGGGLGAQRINDTVAESLDELLKLGSVVLVAGSAQYDELRAITPPNSKHFQLHPFISKDMALLLGAADVVVARAGATTILELAALAKPVILIPNGKLTGGHQLKNAAVYSKKDAVVIIDEEQMLDDHKLLTQAIAGLLANPSQTKAMTQRFLLFARPDAARNMADMILEAVK